MTRWCRHRTLHAHHVPILTITGHYDDDQPGAFDDYSATWNSDSPDATPNHYLIIGPWDHAGTSTPRREVGGLDIGEGSRLGSQQAAHRVVRLDHEGGTKPAFLKKRVAYYVVGAEEWKYADSLETMANDEPTLYLDSNDNAAERNSVRTPHGQGRLAGRRHMDLRSADTRKRETRTSPTTRLG